MEIKEINKRIREVLINQDENEIFHTLEDELYYDFIQYLSEDKNVPKDIKEKAKLLYRLKIECDDFGRWYS